MKNEGILKAGMILIVLGFALNIIGVASASNGSDDIVDDIEEYNGSVGPDNALYGLKLAFENIDESFTWNVSEKLGKKISHSRLRIAEAKTELKRNNNEAAEKALERYKEKVDETEDSILRISGNDSGILYAQKMTKKHQVVLEQLLESHSNNTGLKNAYNRSLELEDKFEQKTERKIERIRTNEGKHILREIKKEKKVENKDDFKNTKELKIRAKITGNDSLIRIELKFDTNSTTNATIARDILNELRLTRENISTILKIENETDDKQKESMEADAQTRMNYSKVNFQYRFTLNETNRTEIIDGISTKLSALSQDSIQDILVIKVMQEEKKDDKEKVREDKGNRKVVTPEKRENKTGNIEDKSEKREDNREDRNEN